MFIELLKLVSVKSGLWARQGWGEIHNILPHTFWKRAQANEERLELSEEQWEKW
jgi:hypothetical protein